MSEMELNVLDPCEVCSYPTCEFCLYEKLGETQIHGWKDGVFYRDGEPVESNPSIVQQPMPSIGQEDVLPQVIRDLEARTEYGVKTYGHPLQTFNGRDALVDAYQEALDLAQFLCQLIMERENNAEEK